MATRTTPPQLVTLCDHWADFTIQLGVCHKQGYSIGQMAAMLQLDEMLVGKLVKQRYDEAYEKAAKPTTDDWQRLQQQIQIAKNLPNQNLEVK